MRPLIISMLLLLLLSSCKKSENNQAIIPAASWHLVSSNKGLTLEAVHFVNSKTGMVVGSKITTDGSYLNGIILKTTNGGTSWDQVTNDTLANLFAVFLTDTLTAYAAGTNCIIKTTDGGNSWSTVLKNSSIHLTSIYFPGKDTGYAVGLSGEIVRTVNGGQSWEFQESKTSCQLHSVYFTNNQTGFAVGYWNGSGSPYGIILKTTNAGAKWDSIPFVGETMPNSVVFSTPNVGYVAGLNSVLKTTDGGSNWTIQFPLSYCFAETVSFIPGSPCGFITSSCGNIIKTVDAGQTWMDMGLSTPSRLMAIYWMDYTIGFAVGYEFNNNTGTIYKWY